MIKTIGSGPSFGGTTLAKSFYPTAYHVNDISWPSGCEPQGLRDLSRQLGRLLSSVSEPSESLT